MKQRCHCGKIATWNYLPDDLEDNPLANKYFCDEHVHRGCSCNIVNNKEEKDIYGRLLPCCEYDYDEFGHDDITTDWDEYALWTTDEYVNSILAAEKEEQDA